jgi:hypothetical protein
MTVRADLKEHHSHAGVLTDRDLFIPGGGHVPLEIAHDLPPEGVFFRVRETADPRFKRTRQNHVRFYAQIAHGVFNEG